MRSREARLEERQLAWVWGLLAVSAVALRPFWLAVAPLVPACHFKVLTGMPCPTCGTTRAAVALLHGDVIGALASNPLAALAGIGFVAGGVAAPVWALAGGRVPEVPTPLPRPARAALVAVLLAAWAYLVVAGR